MPDTKRLRARPARIRVTRQLNDHRPRVQSPHVSISARLADEWALHFDGHGADSAGIELGMQVILYLTGNPNITAHTLMQRLCDTYPDTFKTMTDRIALLSGEFNVRD